jgi:hypothetical protein
MTKQQRTEYTLHLLRTQHPEFRMETPSVNGGWYLVELDSSVKREGLRYDVVQYFTGADDDWCTQYRRWALVPSLPSDYHTA